MLEKRAEEVTEKDVRELLKEQIPEGLRLEYKAKPPGLDDKNQKKEFLRDVTAFANAHGGYIIYGIEEEDGKPKALVGVNLPSSEDAFKQRITNLLRDAVEPPITQHEAAFLEVDGRRLLLLRIPKSYTGPHRISREDFFTRNTVGKHPMSGGATEQLPGSPPGPRTDPGLGGREGGSNPKGKSFGPIAFPPLRFPSRL